MRLARALLFLFLVITAHGIRLEEESKATFSKQIFGYMLGMHQKKDMKGSEGNVVRNAVLCGSDGHCSGIVKKRSNIRKVREVHQKLPSFHEDYYGPRNHKPKHH